MVTKAEQEKVGMYTRNHLEAELTAETIAYHTAAALYPKSRLCSPQIGTSTTREERPDSNEARERSVEGRLGKAKTVTARRDHADDGWGTAGLEFGKG